MSSSPRESTGLAIACLQDAAAAGKRLEAIAGRTGGSRMSREEETVARILEQVRSGGDAALLELSERFDGVRPEPLRIPEERLAEAWEHTPATLQAALDLAHQRILTFHRAQMPAELRLDGPHGERLG
ncbi:MAG: histidinol dehydrogenase, partial [Cyanobium sp.]